MLIGWIVPIKTFLAIVAPWQGQMDINITPPVNIPNHFSGWGKFGLILLALILPFISVGVVDDWGKHTMIVLVIWLAGTISSFVKIDIVDFLSNVLGIMGTCKVY